MSAIFTVFLTGITSVRAAEIIQLPDAKLFPEGIAINSKGGLYIGSLTEGRILYLDPKTHKAHRFIPSGSNGLVSALGLLINKDGDTLYACSSDPGMSELKGSSKPAIVAFDALSGTPRGRFEVPEGGFCNDLTEGPGGLILATDSLNAKIYALKPEENGLRTWLSDQRFSGKGFGLNGITSTSGAVYVVKYNSGQLFKIPMERNGTAGRAVEIQLNRTLKGPDGLKAIGPKKLLVVEGGGLTAGSRGNLSTISLNDDRGVVKIIADDLNVPTTAVIGDNVAFVVEGQLDHLMDPDAGPPEAFRIVKVKLD